MSSNSSGYTPRAISDRSNRDSGYASTSSSSSRTRSIKKISNSRYDRMTAAMEEVASGSNNSKGGKSLGVETIKIIRRGSDSLRGSVEGNKKRIRSNEEMEGVEEIEVVENVEEWWERQEVEKEAKRRRKAQITTNHSGPGASIGSLGEGFKLMSRENNFKDSRSLVEEKFDDSDDQSGFHMEIKKVYSPSGSGRSKTVVRDKRIDESDESEVVSNSRIIVPPWLRRDQSLPSRERTFSPAPPWLANHLYKPAQMIPTEPQSHSLISENIYQDYNQFNQYRSNELELTSSSPFQAPPFSTSGRDSSSVQSAIYREPPRPFYEAQISNTVDYSPTSIYKDGTQNDLNFPRQTFSPNSRANHRSELFSSSSPILPSHYSLPPTPPRIHSLNCNSHGSLSQPSGNSNFDFYQSTTDFLTEAGNPSEEFRSGGISDIHYDSQKEDTLSSFWKNTPNVGVSIQQPSISTYFNRDQYSTRLLRGANAYSTNHIYSDSFDPTPRHPVSTTLQEDSFASLLYPSEQTIINFPSHSQQSNHRTTSPRISPLLLPRKFSDQSRSGRNSITPVQFLPNTQPDRAINIFQNSVSIDTQGKDEDEDLWNAVDGIADNQIVSEVELASGGNSNNDEETGEEKENDEEQLLIEGLKFDWDQESEIISEGIMELQSESEAKELEVVEEEIDGAEEDEAWIVKSQEETVEEEGLGFHIYEDETDPIQEFDYNK